MGLSIVFLINFLPEPSVDKLICLTIAAFFFSMITSDATSSSVDGLLSSETFSDFSIGTCT